MYAHTTSGPKDTWQTLEAHLVAVAEMAASFAEEFNAKEWGYLIGLLHDIGKASTAFQKRLEKATKRVDHATAGGKEVYELLCSFGKSKDFYASLAAYPIMGHHNGLPDGGYAASNAHPTTLTSRRGKKIDDYSAWRKVLPEPPLPPHTLPAGIATAEEGEQGFAVAFFIRMLYSCLVDADWLDTERFCSPERFASRPAPISIPELADQFASFAAQNLQGKSTGNQTIQHWRQKILQQCQKAARKKPGTFSLTVPTGGGKTFSSLAFALEHAKTHSLKRIIYVIPFTSIIEQNAEEFRRALGPYGESAVLEHHSSANEPDAMEKKEDKELLDPTLAEKEDTATTLTDMRLATENWNVSVVVTTSVQFYESLFSNRPSKCRKLHNIANSVIILDEAQMMPLSLLDPCVMALRELVRAYNTTVVLCTATQPSLWYVKDILNSGYNEDEVTEIIEQKDLPGMFEAFKRVAISHAGKLSDEEVAERLLAENQAIVIVNTRRAARTIFELMGQGDGHFHLSAAMYPEHRRKKLREIRQRLKMELPCRVVSTTLIEAGVDIDFPVVYREDTGIDSIAQAAGRCNREGKRQEGGKVFVYSPSKIIHSPFFQRRIVAAKEVFKTHQDVLLPKAIDAYFTTLYSNEDLDKLKLLNKHEESLLDDDFCKQPAIPFAEIAEKFQFIDDNTKSIIVETPEAAALLKRLDASEDYEESRKIIRKLQAYTVQEYTTYAKSLHAEPRTRFSLLVLCGATGYHEDLGLLRGDADYRKAEDNLF